MISQVSRRQGPLRGTITTPADKSLTHRAFLFAACANSKSVILNPLLGEDCLNTLGCLEQLGHSLEVDAEKRSVTLTPSPEWTQPSNPLDCGNSGTTMRLLAGLVASRPLQTTLIGDASLSRRPMNRIALPLKLMGAKLKGETPPLQITGGSLSGIDYMSPVASAQIKSCVLLAGLRAEGETWVVEPSLSRDHTERMLRSLGVTLLSRCDGGIGVRATDPWDGFSMTVPGDISSAAFWIVAASVVPGSEVRLNGTGLNPSRTGILDVMSEVGVTVETDSPREEMGEPVGNLIVRSPKQLAPFTIAGDLVPRLIDEIPVLAVLATQCDGVSEIRDAKELRVKESDRIALVAEGLNAMGARVTALEDGLRIEGPTPLTGTTIHAHGDHRIAMAFAIAGLIAEGTTTLENTDSIQTSYPEFWDHLATLTRA